MKKQIAIAALCGLLAAGPAFGSGYRVPEQSINAVALSNAYIAHTTGPDTAYYNPANMAFQEDRWQMEASASYINLPAIDYKAAGGSNMDSSLTEDIFIPMLHVVSPDYNRFRIGLSCLVPFGLTKRWHDPFPRTSSEDFTLKVFEINPSVSYRISDKIALAAGARVLHARGQVSGMGTTQLTLMPPPTPAFATDLSLDLEGDSTNYGYNLALTVKPTDKWAVAATYRSKVALDLEGEAQLSAAIPLLGMADSYDDYGEVTAQAPAVLTVSTAYTFDRTTVELTWDKTYWSSYDHLDFDYEGALSSNPVLNAIMTAAFDDPKDKQWKDSNAYRLGITHRCTENFTAMLGIAYDESPIPDRTLGFELPGSDAMLYSVGFNYRIDDSLTVGASYLYDRKEERTISASDDNVNGIAGEFDDAGAHVVTMGLVYKF